MRAFLGTLQYFFCANSILMQILGKLPITMDSEIAQKYQQIKDLSTEHATKYNQVFLVENKQSKEVCVLKYAQKIIRWYKQPNRQNKLMNVRHNNLVKIIEMQDTEDYFIVVEE